MFPSCPHLSLAPHWVAENDSRRVVVVRAVDGLRLFHQGELETAPARETASLLERESRSLAQRIRDFAWRRDVGGYDVRRLREHELVSWLAQGIRRGDFVGLRRSRAAGAADEPTLVERRLVRDIERATRGRLGTGGRSYRLVAGADLAAMPDRNRYEVVGREEGLGVLGVLAAELGGRGDLLGLFKEAAAKLSPDWRPPLAPKGLVLLRGIAVERVAASGPAAAITPSQMRAMLETEKPLVFFARFVDDHGKPVSGFAGEFAHGDDPKEKMAFSGAAFAQSAEVKGQRQAWLTLADKANEALVAELKKRWRGIRGEADDGWKAKEECLVEVLLQEGKLPELRLEAEKKHTFMLRPPVALARLRGMYFDTNRCFLLPTAVASLKRLVETYQQHPDSEVLIVGHTDTAGSEAFNLDLSADRADALKAFLRDDADAWLAWYDDGVRASKRWGTHEDLLMIDALVPDEEFGKGSHVAAYQEWHNGQAADARQEDRKRGRPDGWEALKVDGVLGPKTRRQLILDYMNLDGTSLADEVRIVTYGCGEYFPLEGEEGELAKETKDGETVPFDRRVEVFFFAKPFGVLPPVPGVGEGESSKQASQAPKDDQLYLEWRRRVARRYAIDVASEGFRLRLCDEDLVAYANRPFAFCLEGYPEIRGETDENGFVIVDAPPAGRHGYVEVWPGKDESDETTSWEIRIGPVISPVTPLGASTRLANLDYSNGESSDEMTDDLREALRYFQEDNDLPVTGELDEKTCKRLPALHDIGGDDAGPGSDDAESQEG